jgi:hypothetical protein
MYVRSGESYSLGRLEKNYLAFSIYSPGNARTKEGYSVLLSRFEVYRSEEVTRPGRLIFSRFSLVDLEPGQRFFRRLNLVTGISKSLY